MRHENWFPLRYELLPGVFAGRVVDSGDDFQILESNGAARRVLAVRPCLLDSWISAGLVSAGDFEHTSHAGHPLGLFSSVIHALAPLGRLSQPGDRNEALAFAKALRRARAACPDSPMGTAIYAERVGKLLPVPGPDDGGMKDDEVMGRYLCGVPVSCHATRRVAALAPWIREPDLIAIIDAAGLTKPAEAIAQEGAAPRVFSLPGRAALEQFFRDHVIDIVENEERYRALGVPFPSAVVLHGPPGCGKTFAVEALVTYLDWPSYPITSGSIGSPYIHETGRKIGEVFDEAASHAPAVIVLDEMDAFLGSRSDAHRHQVEEVAEFLRRLQDAQKNRVFVVAMTNRPDAVDPAVLRRGRFDHVIEVTAPTDAEVEQVIRHELQARPHQDDVDLTFCAQALAGRPLSDAAFLVREAARLAARSGATSIDRPALDQALATMHPASSQDKRIGF